MNLNSIYQQEKQMALHRWIVIFSLVMFLSGCGYNRLQITDEEINATWSEILNQYQRRADLIPNLVKVVKGFASHEKEVLLGVTEARASLGKINISKDIINNPQAFTQFQQAQGRLSSALSRLMVVVERYPNLKSDAHFLELQAQLEGTENRIAVARNRYIKAVRDYNLVVRKFPSNLTAKLFGYQTKANFSVENEKELAKPPAVEF